MKKILIMESNDTFAAQLADYFSRAGYDVCGVTGDGAEGLALLEKTSPDVAVVSLASPKEVELQGDGAELFRAAGILPAARFLYVGLGMYLYLLHVYVENVIILIQTFSVPE